MADLKGKKIVLNKGSNVHFLLVQALTAAGLKYSDVKTIYLPPAEGRAAFESGNADAWVIWDPFLTVAQKATDARIMKHFPNSHLNKKLLLSINSMHKLLRKRQFDQIIPWSVPISLIIIWQFLVQFGLLSTRVLPAPTAVIQAGIRLFSTGELSRNITVSATRALT